MENVMILAINTGSTSTKIALFNGISLEICETLRHPVGELRVFENVIAQFQYREKAVMDFLIKNKIDLKAICAVVGRGGLLHPIEGGTYTINQLMLEHLRENLSHASNLSCMIAKRIADKTGVPSYTVDPVVVDELEDIARYTGCREIKRYPIWHALNQKAVAKQYANDKQIPYENLNLIVAHIGGGCSVGAHYKGRVIEVTNALNGEGPFTAERAGKLPVESVIDLCASKKYGGSEELKQVLITKMGLLSHLGTNDGRIINERIKQGDGEAKKVYKAMAYQIAKEIGSAAVVLTGEVDGIILTGGFAYDEMLMGWITEYTSFLAPITVIPGEDEMYALAIGAYRVLCNKETAKEYRG